MVFLLFDHVKLRDLGSEIFLVSGEKFSEIGSNLCSMAYSPYTAKYFLTTFKSKATKIATISVYPYFHFHCQQCLLTLQGQHFEKIIWGILHGS